MTRRRWIADEFSGNQAALLGEHAAHLVRVLRVRIGEVFDIVAGASVRQGRVTKVTDQRVEFDLEDEVSSAQTPRVTLLLAIFKFDRMEWAIEKCTELGVARIIPVIATRTDVHLVSAASKRIERWERIARQASEQSRRATAPEFQLPLKLKEAVKVPSPLRIVLSESERQIPLREALASRPSDGELLLAVGPEGGWTDAELALFSQAVWISASLGSTILRAETAAIAATAIAVSVLA
jgi:16S rRNA (uracil1498-N3)-methyltransferase